ncbi:heparan sulfate glucosamine 3-O-sulfotransferase 6-like [Diadema antillarum]|uniref:heparan sulfate glucosamine 3-O-sulfotransferase 6-like n=2 Tax=Diadema antillarum TaxID=105358 RepID=UPI003A878CCB
MREVRTFCWRFRRRILAAVAICSIAYFAISVNMTKHSPADSDVQGLNVDSFPRGGGAGDEAGAGGMDGEAGDQRKDSSRKIHRIPLPEEGMKGQKSQKVGEQGRSNSDAVSDNHQQSETSKPSKKFPQAIIIGVKKGGTRALLDFISLHPNVVVAKKEVHFFDRYFENGLDWYREQMPLSAPGQITIEKTPSYFITRIAPEAISQIDKKMKLIVVVRDPVDRALSDFAQSIATGRRTEGQFDGLAVPDPKTGVVNGSWYPLDIGMYDVHLDRWLQHFPMPQFHFINGNDLIKHPARQLVKLQQFLNIDVIINEDYFVFNKTKGFYCMKQMGTGADEVKCLGHNKGREHPRVSPSVLQSLRKFFKPHNKRLYSMIGENFHWDDSEDQTKSRRRR